MYSSWAFSSLLPLFAGGGDAEPPLWTLGLPLPLLAGGGEGELKVALPLLDG